MKKVPKRTHKSTRRPLPPPEVRVECQLDALLIGIASHRSDRPDDGEMAKALVRHLARRGAPHATGAGRVALLADILANAALVGSDLLEDVFRAVAEADLANDAAGGTAASMAGSVVAPVREIARALSLGADELERLALDLGWEVKG